MARPLMRWICCCLVLLGLDGCSPKPPPVAGLQVRSIGVLERFSRFEAVTGGKRVELFAARNEYEGFQFVITAGDGGAANVQAKVSALRNAAGDVIDGLQVFRERYVKVSTPSPSSPYAPQSWPDILLPADNPAKDVATAYRAFPQNLTAGENLPVWVDVYVPQDTKPGVYSGVVTVTADGEAAQELPVTLKVWNFTLPERSPLRTVFGTNGYRVADVYGFERTGESVADNRLVRAYNDFLLDHHLSPESFWDAAPEADEAGRPDFDRQFAGLGTVTDNMRHYMQDKHASAYTYVFADSYPFADPLGKDRQKAQQFIREYAAWCGQHAGHGRCYTDPSFVDEPDTREAYQYARRWGDFFDEVGEKIRFQVSEPPLNEKPELGSLTGKVDVWIPKFYDLWRDVDYLGKNTVGQRLAAGEEVWAYTALVLDFPEYKKLNPKADVLKGSYPPVWQLDFPAINYRIPAWLLHRYGVTGLGYWDTLSWFDGADVWNDAASFVSTDPPGIRFNGDGLLVYPAHKEQFGFDGPVASLRLKWIRESVEDYMYIDLLLQAGEKAFVDQQLGRIARNFGDWDNDPVLLMQVRQALGEKLEALAQTHQQQGRSQ
ncbi:glycoside hydrolase domain-containing protein [Candidatus Thiothrix sp. Deng01]|uniref:Glycoside hydrolase domain-containing protein n=1 Tax=Candidatus Thiothrix phosphatis TaxID=3112415 RepID=A0ABU6CVI4_9GAMM|nr:glycoside hydrolase domain-containing protein [Candidatus Thiothrix sp. Deng01]MEB4590149.1 glycoside hydrolase domain-containing protein [Candidatus Thiothrix sp. Deng01]